MRPPATSRGRSRPGAQESETLSIEEVIERYPDEWIVLRVTARDEDGWPERGEVITHTRGHARAWAVMGQALAASRGTDRQFYIFCAHPRIKTGVQMRAALQDLMEQDDVSAWWRWQ